jgi:hypothetical protein
MLNSNLLHLNNAFLNVIERSSSFEEALKDVEIQLAMSIQTQLVCFSYSLTKHG